MKYDKRICKIEELVKELGSEKGCCCFYVITTEETRAAGIKAKAGSDGMTQFIAQLGMELCELLKGIQHGRKVNEDDVDEFAGLLKEAMKLGMDETGGRKDN